MKYKEYKPDWVLNSGDKNTYRFCSKWGNHTFFSEPSEALYVFIKERLNLTDEDFIQPLELGDQYIPEALPIKLSDKTISEFEAIVGKINVLTDTQARISCAYGKSAYDSLRLRRAILDNVPDVVVCPTSEEQIITLVEYCYRSGIPMYFSGGRTNTSRATECYKGGVMVDLKRNYNKVINFNEVDQTITVMTGITGSELEEVLNNASEYFDKVVNNYTCGHMPLSFEFSTVGGWVMSRSYGANYSKYGDISDILVSAKYMTSKGIIDTTFNNKSVGMPSVDEIMIGSNGELAVLLSATLKVSRFFPDSKRLFSYLFRDFDSAARCAKEIMQAENGVPCSFRVCDSDDTEIIMRANAVINKGLIAPFVRKLSGNTDRCLLIGTAEGSNSYSRMVKRNVTRTAARYGGVSSTSYLSKKREKNMFSDTYIRDLMLDYNVIMDDVCCNTSWTNVYNTYFAIKDLVERRKHTFCMAHLDKMSPQGCMIVCEYVGKFNSLEEYGEYKNSLLEEISKIASSVSYSHSIGSESSAIMSKLLDKPHLGMLAAMKKYFDPKNLINPR